MKLAMIGLGRMGANMARRLMRDGHELIVFDRDPSKVAEMEKEGARGVKSLDGLSGKTGAYWIMLPAGEITESTVRDLAGIAEPGSILIDGGNSYFKDDIRRSRALAAKKIRYLDVGTSGGVWGLERGYSLMIGGDESAARELDPIFKTLAPGARGTPISKNRNPAGGKSTADEGYLYCGPAGSGHFVKMVHNGIEYGMMQALAEGFDILRGAARDEVRNQYHYELDLREIAEVWRRGSVVSSWLLDLTAIALNEDPDLSSFEGHVADSGEGRWTVQAAVEQAVSATVITSALYTRFRSREERSFAEKVLSAMRRQFGGHAEAPVREDASGREKAS